MAAIDQGQTVRLSEDYFIEARRARYAGGEHRGPGGDYRASPMKR